MHEGDINNLSEDYIKAMYNRAVARVRASEKTRSEVRSMSIDEERRTDASPKAFPRGEAFPGDEAFPRGEAFESRSRFAFTKNKARFALIAAAVAIALAATTIMSFGGWSFDGVQANLRRALGIEGMNIPEYVESNPSMTTAGDASAAQLAGRALPRDGDAGADGGTPADNGGVNADGVPSTDGTAGNDGIAVGSSMPSAEGPYKPLPSSDGSETAREAAHEAPVTYCDATVLSTIRGEEFQTVYVAVGPVTREQAASVEWMAWSGATDDFGNSMWRFVSPADINEESEPKHYDEATQTVTLRANFLASDMGDTPFEARIAGWEEGATQYTLCASVIVAPTAKSAISVAFGDGATFTNPETGETGTVTGAEISATSIVWRYTYKGAYDLFVKLKNHKELSETDKETARTQSVAWLNAFDAAVTGATINLADGTAKGALNTERDVALEGDTCEGYTAWQEPIDTASVTGVTILGQTFAVLDS